MRVLVTGAAGGLGKALVKQLVAARHVVIALDTEQAMSTTYDSSVSLSQCSCSVNLASPEEIEKLILSLTETGPLDVVIHCAAINVTGHFENIKMDLHESTIKVNLRAPMLLTTALLKHQLISTGGTLVFIGSLSSYVSYPGASVYAATKDGLLSYGRSLCVELSKSGLHSLSVLPGPLRPKHAQIHAPPNTNANARLSPDVAAQKILSAISRRQQQLVPGIRANIFRLASFIIPGITERFMRTHIFLPLTKQ